MGVLEVVVGDITKLEVDVIVNAANPSLLGGGGVDGAIHREAGPGLLAACREITESAPGVRCPTGQARITAGFQLRARWIVHTVGPVWRGGTQRESELLASSYVQSLELAASHAARSIAFPAISTGVYGFPQHLASRIASRRCAEFLRGDSSLERIVLVAFQEPAAALLRAEVREATRAPATRNDWKSVPMPALRRRLNVEQTFSRGQFGWLRQGSLPREMEDRWFVFFEPPWLYVHRSWTGACIFQVKLEPHADGARITEAWVNRNQEDYAQHDDAYDEKQLAELLNGWAG